MPIQQYFKGSGEKVMKNMQDQYGDVAGKSAFYATAEKQGQTPKKGSGGKAEGKTPFVGKGKRFDSLGRGKGK